MKPLSHRNKKSIQLVEVTKTVSASGISSFDNYLYFVDAGLVYTVEEFGDGTFSAPRYFDGEKGAIRVTQMLTFKLRAISMRVTILASLALFLLI